MRCEGTLTRIWASEQISGFLLYFVNSFPFNSLLYNSKLRKPKCGLVKSYIYNLRWKVAKNLIRDFLLLPLRLSLSPQWRQTRRRWRRPTWFRRLRGLHRGGSSNSFFFPRFCGWFLYENVNAGRVSLLFWFSGSVYFVVVRIRARWMWIPPSFFEIRCFCALEFFEFLV